MIARAHASYGAQQPLWPIAIHSVANNAICTAQVDVLSAPVSLFYLKERGGRMILVCQAFLVLTAVTHVLLGVHTVLQYLRCRAFNALVRSAPAAHAYCNCEHP